LAAARISLLSTAQLLERLGDRLDLLRGGRDAEIRQQTLRTTIEWSYELLESEERKLLAALSVFRGGWTLEAAEQVAAADLELMQSLVDKSLVRRWETGRFGMLETIREFAAEQLEHAGEAEHARRSHADYFLELAEEAGLCVEGIEAGSGELGYVTVLPERDNIRAALDLFFAADEIEAPARLAVSLEQYWVTNSPEEGVRVLGRLYERKDELAPELRVRVIRSLAGSTYIQGGSGFDEGALLCDEAFELYRQLGEEWGIAHMLLRRAVDQSRRGNLAEAKRLLEESLALWRSPFNEAQVALQLGSILFREGRIEEALELADRAARLAHQIDFVWWEKNALEAGAEFALLLGRVEDGRERACSGLSIGRSIGDRQGTVYGLALLVWAAADAGEAERAGRLWGAIEAEAGRSPIGQWEAERDEYVARLAPVTGEDFDRGVEEGRRMTLDDAVVYALGDQT
jgi:tetratricopeptide (TPR) repeat protein